LKQRDVSAFNPKAIPFRTEYKERLIYTGMSNAEGYIFHMIEKQESPFKTDIISGPWHVILKELSQAAPDNLRTKMVQPALFHALKEAGWVDKGLCMSPKYTSKRHIFVRPDLASLPKAKLREMVEPDWKDNVISIKS
jgi:hypothetical protein